MTTTEVFKIPHHGSYPQDFCQLAPRLTFDDPRPYGGTCSPTVAQIILGLINRVYPDATEASVQKYGNKNFTIVGYTYPGDYIVVYLHDYVWTVARMARDAYDDWIENKPYYAAVPEELPRC